ncbi:hypothetical protein D9M68_711070 [compost metagenome]
MDAQLDARSQLAQAQGGEVFGIAILGFPRLEIAVIAFAAFDVVQPLVEFVIALGLPRRRHGKPVEVGQIVRERLHTVADEWPWRRQTRPGGQVLHGARLHQHVPVHVQEILPGAIAVPLLAPCIALLAEGPGLPAKRPQRLTPIFLEPVPAITASMP